jgi:hypothetical protein
MWSADALTASLHQAPLRGPLMTYVWRFGPIANLDRPALRRRNKVIGDVTEYSEKSACFQAGIVRNRTGGRWQNRA